MWWMSFVFFLVPVTGFAEDLSELPRLLNTYCTKCHGVSPQQGGFDSRRLHLGLSPDDRAKLKDRVVELEDMPEDYDKLSAGPQAEVKKMRELIKQWIDSGGGSLVEKKSTRVVLTNEEILTLVHNDLAQSPDIGGEVRYLSLQNLYNYFVQGEPVFDDIKLRRLADGLSKLVNSLSWNASVVPLSEVPHSKGVLWRVRLSHYNDEIRGLTKTLWDRIGAADPYQISHETPAYERIKSLSGTKFPIIRGDFFAVQASRDFYYEAMGFDFFKRDQKLNVSLPQIETQLLGKTTQKILAEASNQNIVRAGFLRSGVSVSNRLLERHDITTHRDGAYWHSYDFEASEGKKQLAQNPLGPEGAFSTENAFKHDGGEVIFSLPNGLHAYVLANAKGQLLVDAPFQIVRHPVKGTIFNAVSCFDCHREGLIDKGDEIRRFTEDNQDLFNARDLLKIRQLYPDRRVAGNSFDRLMGLDNQRYAKALAQTSVTPTPVDFQAERVFEPLTEITDYFAETVSLEKALSEVGMSSGEFTSRLREQPDLRRVIGAYAQNEPQAVDRQAFKKLFPKMIEALELNKVKGDDAFRIRSEAVDSCDDGKVVLLFGADQRKEIGSGKSAMDQCLAMVKRISRSDLRCVCER